MLIFLICWAMLRYEHLLLVHAFIFILVTSVSVIYSDRPA